MHPVLKPTKTRAPRRTRSTAELLAAERAPTTLGAKQRFSDRIACILKDEESFRILQEGMRSSNLATHMSLKEHLSQLLADDITKNAYFTSRTLVKAK